MKKLTVFKKKSLDVTLIEDENVYGIHKILINGKTFLVSSNLYHTKDIYNWIINNVKTKREVYDN